MLTYCHASRIFQIPKLGTKLKQDAIPLSYTPRKFIPHPTNGLFYLIEGDHRVRSDAAVARLVQEKVDVPLVLPSTLN